MGEGRLTKHLRLEFTQTIPDLHSNVDLFRAGRSSDMDSVMMKLAVGTTIDRSFR